MGILDLLQHTTTPTSLYNLPDGFYEGLMDALAANNQQAVGDYLKQIPREEHHDPKLVGWFLAHFSPQTMGILFNEVIGVGEFFEILNANEVVSEAVWRWLIDERQLSVDFFVDQAIQKLTDSNLADQQQQSLVHFLTATHSGPIYIADVIAPKLAGSCVDHWAECVWSYLRTFPHESWKQSLENLDMHHFLQTNRYSPYTNLTKSLQNIPNFQNSFDQHFENLHQQYLEFVKTFSSAKGLKHSPGFKKLPRALQNRLDYEKTRLYDPEDGVLIGKYKDILGYTNDELFLKNFGFEDLDFEYEAEDEDEAPALKFLSRLRPIHPLHIILQKFEGFLQFDSNATGLIAQHLNHPLILQNVFDYMRPSHLSDILQQHPQLAQWKDDKGNSLGHWCAANTPFNQEWAQIMIEYPALLEPNEKGFTLREIVRRDIELENVEEEDLAALDHILISQAVSDLSAPKNRVRKI